MDEYIEYLPVFREIHDLSMDAFRRNDKKEACCYNNTLNILCNAPAADVVPVVRGCWENYPSNLYLRCSACKVEFYKQRFKVRANYCPNCGADMRERKGGAE